MVSLIICKKVNSKIGIKNPTKMDYIIHTDGAYSRMHNEGAFAYVICDGNDKEIKRRAWKISNETNNRAELKAIIAGLHNLPANAKKVIVISDSMYALNTCSGNWSRNANTDLFDIHDKIVMERGLNVSYKWVKGHNGDYFNEICDQMCNDVLGYDANAEFQRYKK